MWECDIMCVSFVWNYCKCRSIVERRNQSLCYFMRRFNQIHSSIWSAMFHNRYDKWNGTQCNERVHSNKNEEIVLFIDVINISLILFLVTKIVNGISMIRTWNMSTLHSKEINGYLYMDMKRTFPQFVTLFTIFKDY